MALVFFVYGLAFFTMGLSIAVYPKRESGFKFADALPLLAAFGLLHGLNEWLDMALLLRVGGDVALKTLGAVLMASSFFCLLLFGVKTVMRIKECCAGLVFAPPALLAAWAAITAASGDSFLMADIWSRYLLGLPGALIAGYALRLQAGAVGRAGLKKPARFLRLSAWTFLLYGALAGVVVPAADFFPASVFNYSAFRSTLGAPVQVFRALCAVLVAYAMYRVLDVFEWETVRALKESRDDLERSVRERTKSLLESEEMFRTLAEQSPAMIFINFRGRIVYVNQKCVEATGYKKEEFYSPDFDFMGLIAPESAAVVRDNFGKYMEGDEPSPHENVLITKAGRRLEAMTSLKVIKYGGSDALLGIVVDLTEHKALEEQLRQSQKMEALGTLTGGIAHEFNNIMTAIMGYGEFLQGALERGTPQREYADFIAASAERAARLTDGLLAYSRKKLTRMEPTDINETLKTTTAYFSSLIRPDVAFITETSGEPLVVMADAAQVEHVLINLATNALDAMPDGGALTITTGSAEFATETVLGGKRVKPGRYALVAVKDTGVGMDRETMEKIFEPFFTTKEVGKGTGLGLSMVYGIVDRHGGAVTVESWPGKGAAFRVYLPLFEGPAAGAREREQAAEPAGTGTVLVAEDDGGVRGLVREVLQQAGYSVIEAADGAEAVEKFARAGGAVDLLLFDIAMPGMDGISAFTEIRKSAPAVKAVLMSGRTADDERLKEAIGQGCVFMKKPITPRDLLAGVREALSGRGGTQA